MFDVSVGLIHRYIGVGAIFALTIAAVVYLAITKKNKTVKAVLVMVPVMSLMFFFIPTLGTLVGKLVGEQAFFRFLWMIPNSIIVAYAAVDIITKTKWKMRIVAGLALALMIMLCGEFIYTSPNYEKAENIYHIPKPVVDICDRVIIPGREVMVAFPSDLMLYVRQYSPYVCMPYGRDAYIGVNDDEIYSMMLGDEFYFEEFTRLCEEESKSCHYIVIDVNKKVIGNPENVGFELFDIIDGYAVFKNNNQNFELE